MEGRSNDHRLSERARRIAPQRVKQRLGESILMCSADLQCTESGGNISEEICIVDSRVWMDDYGWRRLGLMLLLHLRCRIPKFGRSGVELDFVFGT